MADELWEQCKRAVGCWVRYKGTNGNEYDKANHGEPVEGEGYCCEYHDAHGLCIGIRYPDVQAEKLFVDPSEVEVVAPRDEVGSQVQKAKEALKDPEKRREWDKQQQQLLKARLHWEKVCASF